MPRMQLKFKSTRRFASEGPTNVLAAMIHSIVRKKLVADEVVVCAKASYVDPEIVEMIGQAGFDCVWICLEHRRLDPSVIKTLILASLKSGCDCMVRVKPRDHTDLAYLLEAGARGIMVPQVRGVEEVEEVVAMMKFPPVGRRGFDVIHADADMGSVSLEDYVAHENDNTFLVVQIETPEVIPDIDAIAAMPGVDMLFVGLGDLSASLGLLGQMDHPRLREIVREVGAACQRHGKAAAIICTDAEERKRLWEEGYRFFNIASDFRFIRQGFDAAIRDASDLRGMNGDFI